MRAFSFFFGLSGEGEEFGGLGGWFVMLFFFWDVFFFFFFFFKVFFSRVFHGVLG